MKEAMTPYPTTPKKAIAMVSLPNKDLVEIQAKGLLSELYDINQILLVSLRVRDLGPISRKSRELFGPVKP